MTGSFKSPSDVASLSYLPTPTPLWLGLFAHSRFDLDHSPKKDALGGTSRDKGQRIAVNVAKLPELLRQ
jgi:hypothetical protein